MTVNGYLSWLTTSYPFPLPYIFIAVVSLAIGVTAQRADGAAIAGGNGGFFLLLLIFLSL